MSSLLTAPEIIVKINGTISGYATGLSFTASQGQKPIFGVDSPFAQEIAQGAAPALVQGSMVVFRPKGASPEAWNIMTPRASADGKDEDGNAQTTALGSGQYSILELEDRQTNRLILKVGGVMFGIQSWNVQARGIMQGQVQFQGTVLFNSKEGLYTGSLF